MSKNCNECGYQKACNDHFLYCPLDGHNTPIENKKEAD